jgi:hypothetical protein
LKSLVRGITTEKEAETVLKELKRLGFLKGYILAGTDKARDLTGFLAGFWDWKTSPYVQEKLRKKHSIHEIHCLQMARAIRMYWKPYFEGRLLGELTRQEVNAFIDSLGKRAVEPAKGRKNDQDLSTGIIYFSGKPKERQILSPELAAAVFRVSWRGPGAAGKPPAGPGPRVAVKSCRMG